MEEKERGAVEVLFCFCFFLELGTREEGREGEMERREERRKGEKEREGVTINVVLM